MPRPKKEEVQDIAQGFEQEIAQSEQPTNTKKVDLGYNKEYIEYEIEVKAVFKRSQMGGTYVHKYVGTRKMPKRENIRVESFRADQLNKKWFSRKLMLLEVGDDTTTFETIIND